jgi:hypothetical protein
LPASFAAKSRSCGKPQDAEVEAEIRERVTQVLQSVNSRTVVRERRRDRRYAYPYPLHLTPLDDRDQPAGPAIVVLGKHLSEGGIDFYHDAPLPYRRVLISLENRGQQQVDLLLQLTWCRFTRHGWYENGGRFVKAMSASRAAGRTA